MAEKITNFIMVRIENGWLCREALDLHKSDTDFIKKHAEEGRKIIICHDIFDFMNETNVTEYDIDFDEIKN